jgi:hypothetical protein
VSAARTLEAGRPPPRAESQRDILPGTPLRFHARRPRHSSRRPGSGHLSHAPSDGRSARSGSSRSSGTFFCRRGSSPSHGLPATALARWLSFPPIRARSPRVRQCRRCESLRTSMTCRTSHVTIVFRTIVPCRTSHVTVYLKLFSRGSSSWRDHAVSRTVSLRRSVSLQSTHTVTVSGVLRIR